MFPAQQPQSCADRLMQKQPRTRATKIAVVGGVNRLSRDMKSGDLHLSALTGWS
jgi:hypothetical protein